MSKGTSPMSANIAEKILCNLESNHGCNIETVKTTAEGSTVEIKDAFGFIYSVEVKTIGRAAPESVKGLIPETDKLLERVK